MVLYSRLLSLVRPPPTCDLHCSVRKLAKCIILEPVPDARLMRVVKTLFHLATFLLRWPGGCDPLLHAPAHPPYFAEMAELPAPLPCPHPPSKSQMSHCDEERKITSKGLEMYSYHACGEQGTLTFRNVLHQLHWKALLHSDLN